MGIVIDTKTAGIVTTEDLLVNIEDRRIELHELKPQIKRALELVDEIDNLYYTLKKFVPDDVNVFTATFNEEKNAYIKGGKIDG